MCLNVGVKISHVVSEHIEMSRVSTGKWLHAVCVFWSVELAVSSVSLRRGNEAESVTLKVKLQIAKHRRSGEEGLESHYSCSLASFVRIFKYFFLYLSAIRRIFLFSRLIFRDGWIYARLEFTTDVFFDVIEVKLGGASATWFAKLCIKEIHVAYLYSDKQHYLNLFQLISATLCQQVDDDFHRPN